MPKLRLLPWAALAVGVACACVLALGRGEAELPDSEFPLLPRCLTYAATSTTWRGSDPRVYRRLAVDSASISVEYGFITTRDDQIKIALGLATDQYRLYRDRFGYRQQELSDLFDNQKKGLDAAYAVARKRGAGKAELQLIHDRAKEDYQDNLKKLVRTRGFRYVRNGVISADIPTIVANNVENLNPVAITLAENMDKLGYGSADLTGATLPLIQTAIEYFALPMQRDGKETTGFALPLEVLFEGRGDCDSKSALLAALLLNWNKVKLIGVGLPGHYLLGIMQHPGRGDTYMEYKGNTYVLMEPSGPAWLPPGAISSYSRDRLAAGERTMVDELTWPPL